MSKPVCLVTGVGPEKGTGGEVAKRFSEGGYQVAMLARNKDNLAEIEQKIEGARAFPCDVEDTLRYKAYARNLAHRQLLFIMPQKVAVVAF